MSSGDPEDILRAAMRDHADRVGTTAPTDPTALTRRLDARDRFVKVRNVGVATAAVAVVVVGAVFVGQGRNEKTITTATSAEVSSNTTLRAGSSSTTAAADPSTTTSAPDGAVPGTDPDGSTTIVSLPPGATPSTTLAPGQSPTATTTAPNNPFNPGTTTTVVKPVTTTTTKPTTTTTSINPDVPPTGDPDTWCTAFQRNTTWSDSQGLPPKSVFTGWAPPAAAPGSLVQAWADSGGWIPDAKTRADAQGKWQMIIEFSNSTPYDTPIGFTVGCSPNGHQIHFTFTRTR